MKPSSSTPNTGYGNTEGKRRLFLDKTDLAYIAGFLDGDGCVMLQLIRRKDYRLGFQIRASIVFYQKSEQVSFLILLKDLLQCGYIRHRNDGMSELTIVGPGPVSIVLQKLLPYLRLKKLQAELALLVIKQMPSSGRNMTPELLIRLSKEVDKFALLNYSKKRQNFSTVVERYLLENNLFDPVETDP